MLAKENIRSEGVTELISYKPGWLVRQGIVLFFFILIAVGVACYFIQYPDIVYGKAKIIAIDAPGQLIAETDGRVMKLVKAEGSQCATGDTVAFLESTDKHGEIIQLPLIASIDGVVNYTGTLQGNQEVNANQPICSIVPSNTQFFCEINLTGANFRKVRTGQKVLLKFQSYPYQQFGFVTARISLIKNTDTDSVYLVKAILAEGLLTNYNKRLTYKAGMNAEAEIITEKIRMTSRFINGFRKLMN